MRDLLFSPSSLRGARLAALLLASLLGAFLLIGELRHGSWYPIDDPEILGWMGTRGRVSLADAPSVLRTTEVATPGGYSRFRPVYYTLKVAESVVWGAHAERWLGARVVMFGVVIFGAWWALTAAVGFVPATFLTWLLTSQYYWGDVWAHVCLGEQYAAVFVVAMLGAGFVLADRIRDGRSADAVLVVMSVTAALATGAKENFAVLAVPLVGAALVARRRRAVGAGALVAVALSLAAIAFVIGAVLIGAAQTGGVDVYQNSTAAGSRLKVLAGRWPRFVYAAVVMAIVAGFGLRAWVARTRPVALKAVERVLLQQAAMIALITIIFLFQVVIYNGQFPSFGGRYDFPGRTVEVAVYASAIVALRGLATAIGFDARRAVLAFCLLIGGYALRNGLHVTESVHLYVTTTTRMRDAIAEILRQANGTTAPVVLTSGGPEDFEAVMFVPGLLRVLRAPNKVFLRPPPYGTEQFPDRFGKYVAGLLVDASRNGAYDLRPLRELNAALAGASGKCVALQLHGYKPFVPIPCDASFNAGKP